MKRTSMRIAAMLAAFICWAGPGGRASEPPAGDVDEALSEATSLCARLERPAGIALATATKQQRIQAGHDLDAAKRKLSQAEQAIARRPEVARRVIDEAHVELAQLMKALNIKPEAKVAEEGR